MAVDAKKVFEKLKGESDRGKVTLYLDKDLLKKFRKVCEPNTSASRVLEELMKEFIESAAKDFKKK